MRSVQARELAWVLLWSAGVMAVTAVPYHIARSEAGPDRQFTGFIWGVDDGNAYLAWTRQAAEGRVLLRNQYTTKSQDPHFFNVFLLALGRVCRATGLSPLTVFMGSRYLFGVFLLLAFYLLMAELTPDRLARWLALTLVSMSSGLGWLVVLFGQEGGQWGPVACRPMDVSNGWQTQPEAITFLSLLLNPLFTFSLALLALMVVQIYRLQTDPGLGSAVKPGRRARR